MKMHLQQIEIEGYRGIERLSLNLDQQINIFVGRNNTGKSSILEAIMLAATAPNLYHDVLNNDLLQTIRDRLGSKSIKYLINVNELSAEIKMRHERGSIDVIIVSSSKIKELEKEILQRTNIGKMIQKYPEIKMSQKKEAIYFFTFIDEAPYQYYCGIDEEGEIFRKGKSFPSELIFMGYEAEPSLIELYDTLTRRGLIKKVIKNVREDIQYFEDLRLAATHELLVFLNWLEEPLPIELMGDGFKEMLRIAMLASVAEDKKVSILLEEPERHLHPGFMELVTDYIARVARERKAQFFISTHSSELLESLIDKATTVTKVFRMYREFDGRITYEYFTGLEAKELLAEIKEDLRGI